MAFLVDFHQFKMKNVLCFGPLSTEFDTHVNLYYGTQTVIIKALLSIHNAYLLVRVCIPAIANINAELDTANFKFEYKGYNLGKVILW